MNNQDACEKAWNDLQDFKNKQRLDCLNSRAVFFEAFQAAYELRDKEIEDLKSETREVPRLLKEVKRLREALKFIAGGNKEDKPI